MSFLEIDERAKIAGGKIIESPEFAFEERKDDFAAKRQAVGGKSDRFAGSRGAVLRQRNPPLFDERGDGMVHRLLGQAPQFGQFELSNRVFSFGNAHQNDERGVRDAVLRGIVAVEFFDAGKN